MPKICQISISMGYMILFINLGTYTIKKRTLNDMVLYIVYHMHSLHMHVCRVNSSAY